MGLMDAMSNPLNIPPDSTGGSDPVAREVSLNYRSPVRRTTGLVNALEPFLKEPLFGVEPLSDVSTPVFAVDPSKPAMIMEKRPPQSNEIPAASDRSFFEAVRNMHSKPLEKVTARRRIDTEQDPRALGAVCSRNQAMILNTLLEEISASNNPIFAMETEKRFKQVLLGYSGLMRSDESSGGLFAARGTAFLQEKGRQVEGRGTRDKWSDGLGDMLFVQSLIRYSSMACFTLTRTECQYIYDNLSEEVQERLAYTTSDKVAAPKLPEPAQFVRDLSVIMLSRVRDKLVKTLPGTNKEYLTWSEDVAGDKPGVSRITMDLSLFKNDALLDFAKFDKEHAEEWLSIRKNMFELGRDVYNYIDTDHAEVLKLGAIPNRFVFYFDKYSREKKNALKLSVDKDYMDDKGPEEGESGLQFYAELAKLAVVDDSKLGKYSLTSKAQKLLKKMESDGKFRNPEPPSSAQLVEHKTLTAPAFVAKSKTVMADWLSKNKDKYIGGNTVYSLAKGTYGLVRSTAKDSYETWQTACDNKFIPVTIQDYFYKDNKKPVAILSNLNVSEDFRRLVMATVDFALKKIDSQQVVPGSILASCSNPGQKIVRRDYFQNKVEEYRRSLPEVLLSYYYNSIEKQALLFDIRPIGEPDKKVRAYDVTESIKELRSDMSLRSDLIKTFQIYDLSAEPLINNASKRTEAIKIIYTRAIDYAKVQYDDDDKATGVAILGWLKDGKLSKVAGLFGLQCPDLREEVDLSAGFAGGTNIALWNAMVKAGFITGNPIADKAANMIMIGKLNQKVFDSPDALLKLYTAGYKYSLTIVFIAFLEKLKELSGASACSKADKELAAAVWGFLIDRGLVYGSKTQDVFCGILTDKFFAYDTNQLLSDMTISQKNSDNLVPLKILFRSLKDDKYRMDFTGIRQIESDMTVADKFVQTGNIDDIMRRRNLYPDVLSGQGTRFQEAEARNNLFLDDPVLNTTNPIRDDVLKMTGLYNTSVGRFLRKVEVRSAKDYNWPAHFLEKGLSGGRLYDDNLVDLAKKILSEDAIGNVEQFVHDCEIFLRNASYEKEDAPGMANYISKRIGELQGGLSTLGRYDSAPSRLEFLLQTLDGYGNSKDGNIYLRMALVRAHREISGGAGVNNYVVFSNLLACRKYLFEPYYNKDGTPNTGAIKKLLSKDNSRNESNVQTEQYRVWMEELAGYLRTVWPPALAMYYLNLACGVKNPMQDVNKYYLERNRLQLKQYIANDQVPEYEYNWMISCIDKDLIAKDIKMARDNGLISKSYDAELLTILADVKRRIADAPPPPKYTIYDDDKQWLEIWNPILENVSDKIKAGFMVNRRAIQAQEQALFSRYNDITRPGTGDISSFLFKQQELLSKELAQISAPIENMDDDKKIKYLLEFAGKFEPGKARLREAAICYIIMLITERSAKDSKSEEWLGKLRSLIGDICGTRLLSRQTSLFSDQDENLVAWARQMLPYLSPDKLYALRINSNLTFRGGIVELGRLYGQQAELLRNMIQVHREGGFETTTSLNILQREYARVSTLIDCIHLLPAKTLKESWRKVALAGRPDRMEWLLKSPTLGFEKTQYADLKRQYIASQAQLAGNIFTWCVGKDKSFPSVETRGFLCSVFGKGVLYYCDRFRKDVLFDDIGRGQALVIKDKASTMQFLDKLKYKKTDQIKTFVNEIYASYDSASKKLIDNMLLVIIELNDTGKQDLLASLFGNQLPAVKKNADGTLDTKSQTDIKAYLELRIKKWDLPVLVKPEESKVLISDGMNDSFAAERLITAIDFFSEPKDKAKELFDYCNTIKKPELIPVLLGKELTARIPVQPSVEKYLARQFESTERNKVLITTDSKKTEEIIYKFYRNRQEAKALSMIKEGLYTSLPGIKVGKTEVAELLKTVVRPLIAQGGNSNPEFLLKLSLNAIIVLKLDEEQGKVLSTVLSDGILPAVAVDIRNNSSELGQHYVEARSIIKERRIIDFLEKIYDVHITNVFQVEAGRTNWKGIVHNINRNRMDMFNDKYKRTMDFITSKLPDEAFNEIRNAFVACGGGNNFNAQEFRDALDEKKGDDTKTAKTKIFVFGGFLKTDVDIFNEGKPITPQFIQSINLSGDKRIEKEWAEKIYQYMFDNGYLEKKGSGKYVLTYKFNGDEGYSRLREYLVALKDESGALVFLEANSEADTIMEALTNQNAYQISLSRVPGLRNKDQVFYRMFSDKIKSILQKYHPYTEWRTLRDDLIMLEENDFYGVNNAEVIFKERLPMLIDVYLNMAATVGSPDPAQSMKKAQILAAIIGLAEVSYIETRDSFGQPCWTVTINYKGRRPLQLKEVYFEGGNPVQPDELKAFRMIGKKLIPDKGTGKKDITPAQLREDRIHIDQLCAGDHNPAVEKTAAETVVKARNVLYSLSKKLTKEKAGNKKIEIKEETVFDVMAADKVKWLNEKYAGTAAMYPLLILYNQSTDNPADFAKAAALSNEVLEKTYYTNNQERGTYDSYLWMKLSNIYSNVRAMELKGDLSARVPEVLSYIESLFDEGLIKYFAISNKTIDKSTDKLTDKSENKVIKLVNMQDKVLLYQVVQNILYLWKSIIKKNEQLPSEIDKEKLKRLNVLIVDLKRMVAIKEENRITAQSELKSFDGVGIGDNFIKLVFNNMKALNDPQVGLQAAITGMNSNVVQLGDMALSKDEDDLTADPGMFTRFKIEKYFEEFGDYLNDGTKVVRDKSRSGYIRALDIAEAMRLAIDYGESKYAEQLKSAYRQLQKKGISVRISESEYYNLPVTLLDKSGAVPNNTEEGYIIDGQSPDIPACMRFASVLSGIGGAADASKLVTALCVYLKSRLGNGLRVDITVLDPELLTEMAGIDTANAAVWKSWAARSVVILKELYNNKKYIPDYLELRGSDWNYDNEASFEGYNSYRVLYAIENVVKNNAGGLAKDCYPLLCEKILDMSREYDEYGYLLVGERQSVMAESRGERGFHSEVPYSVGERGRKLIEANMEKIKSGSYESLRLDFDSLMDLPDNIIILQENSTNKEEVWNRITSGSDAGLSKTDPAAAVLSKQVSRLIAMAEKSIKTAAKIIKFSPDKVYVDILSSPTIRIEETRFDLLGK